MSDFDERLHRAIERGNRHLAAQEQAKQAQAMTEEQFKRLHAQLRLPLTEHIERCLARLPPNFPGFRFETVIGDRGWGAAVSRDDVSLGGGDRRNLFSRLEMLIRPFSSAHVLELTARGTIRNKEVYSRTHYQILSEADPETFTELVDLWVLEYAELYASKR